MGHRPGLDDCIAVKHCRALIECVCACVQGHRPGLDEPFLEQWHQKLHTNTTPDDIAICEAYLAFLHRSVRDSLVTMCTPTPPNTHGSSYAQAPASVPFAAPWLCASRLVRVRRSAPLYCIVLMYCCHVLYCYCYCTAVATWMITGVCCGMWVSSHGRT